MGTQAEAQVATSSVDNDAIPELKVERKPSDLDTDKHICKFLASKLCGGDAKPLPVPPLYIVRPPSLVAMSCLAAIATSPADPNTTALVDGSVVHRSLRGPASGRWHKHCPGWADQPSPAAGTLWSVGHTAVRKLCSLTAMRQQVRGISA